MLILARKLNERIVIGDDIEISVVEIKGDQVKLGVNAPRDVKVYRHEVYEAIQKENRKAAESATEIPEMSDFLSGDDTWNSADGNNSGDGSNGAHGRNGAGGSRSD